MGIWKTMYIYTESHVNEFRGIAYEAASVLADILGASLRELVMHAIDMDGPYWCTYDITAGILAERVVTIADRSTM